MPKKEVDKEPNFTYVPHYGLVQQGKNCELYSAKTELNLLLNDCLSKSHPFGFPYPFEV